MPKHIISFRFLLIGVSFLCLAFLLHECTRDKGIIKVTAQIKDEETSLDGVILLKNLDWRTNVSDISVYLLPASLSSELGKLETSDGVVSEIIYGDHNQFRDIRMTIKPSIMKAHEEYRIAFHWHKQRPGKIPVQQISDIQGYVRYHGSWVWGEVFHGQWNSVWFTFSPKSEEGISSN